MGYIVGWILGAILVGFAGLNRKGGYLRAFLIALLLSPLIGIILVRGSAQKNPKGCTHCGNKENEADYCGLCYKNEEGLTREEVLKQNEQEL